jgi:glycosyltransferase involved in cell wall biosynthesis
MKGISYIIPCFNAGVFIEEAIESILFQPHLIGFEIIIVNDGSTDELTISYMNSYIDHDNIKIINFEINKGAQFARSEGIRAAEYDYILPIDADDCLSKDNMIYSIGTYADRAVTVLETNSDTAFVQCISCMFDGFSGFTISAYPVTCDLVLKKHHVPTPIVYRKCDAIKAGLYCESILKWQDWSFAVSILNYRYKEEKKNHIQFIDFPYYMYRIHNCTERISKLDIAEKDMVIITLKNNMEIFQQKYGDFIVEELAELIISNKPSRLIDLLHVASFNIEYAKELIEHRRYDLVSLVEYPLIP